MHFFRLLVLSIASAFLWVHTSWANGLRCVDLFAISKTPQIETSLELNLKTNNFTRNRGLKEYKEELQSRYLNAAIERLNENSIWIDMGAGEAKAQRQVLEQKKIKQAVALAYEKPESSELDQFEKNNLGHFIYLRGAMLEKMFFDGQLNTYRSSVELITDVFGPASYSKELDRVISIYADLLKVGGEIHLNIPLLNLRGEGSEYTSVQFKKNPNMDGAIESWLSDFRGLEVVSMSEGGGNDFSKTVVLRKTSDDVVIPQLKLNKYDGSRGPPRRAYDYDPQLKASGWSPFQYMKSGTPIKRFAVKKAIDKLDAQMMLTSFKNAVGKGQPIEMAVMEVLDKKGNVLYATPIEHGHEKRHIVFVDRILEMAFSFAKNNSEAKTIRFRHTHPGNWEGSNLPQAVSWKFSEPDIKVNEIIRSKMNEHPSLKKMNLDVFIVYIRPTVTSFGHYLEDMLQIIETRGYRLGAKFGNESFKK